MINILSGDRKETLVDLSKKLGIKEDEINDLLPEMKLNIIENLMKNNKVAMVGDGINDALVALAASNLGIAVGSGTQIAKANACCFNGR